MAPLCSCSFWPKATRHLSWWALALALASASIAQAQNDPREDPRVGVPPETAEVIDGALAWLATQQLPDGSWSTGKPGRTSYKPAMTAYTITAFLAAGHLPGQGRYGEQVQRGVDFLLDSVLPSGILRTDNRRHYMYSHGIVLFVLSELYGEYPDPRVRESIERLVEVTIQAQNGEGGWRYQPRPSSADISATVIQATAIRAARSVGVNVPQTVFERAADYVRACHVEGTGGFRYQAANEQGPPGFARTAAAVYSLQVLGYYDDPLIVPATEYMFAHFGQGGWFTYGNYYAAPAMYMVGGEQWPRWYETVSERLLRDVNRQGNLCFWGSPDSGRVGPVYETAVYTMILAIPYNFIPLYQR